MGVRKPIDVEPEHVEVLRGLLQSHLPGVAAWAFGSRVKWTSRPDSDLDLVVFAKPEQNRQVHALKEALEESSLPFRVDVLVWDAVSEAFHDNIRQQYVELMRAEWPTFEIGQLAKLRSGFPFKSADWKETGVPVIKIANIKAGRIVPDGCGFVSTEVASKVAEWYTRSGDVLIAMNGYVGELAQVKPGEHYLINQRVGRFEFMPEAEIEPAYFFYHLQHPDTRREIEGVARGSAQPNLSASDAHKIKITLPPLTVQREIAATLGALDDRITLLRETNATLEAIAQALFKSWFVEFDPVRAKMEGRTPEGMDEVTAALFPDSFEETELGVVPRGWRVGSVYEYAKVIYGAPFASKQFKAESPGTPLVRIRDLKDERPGVFTEEVHPKGYLLQPGDIAVGMDGEFRAYVWGGEEAWLNQRVCVFQPINGACTAFVRLSITPLLAAVEASETATTVIHLGKNDIDRFTSVVPAPGVLLAFAKAANPLYERLVTNKQEAQTLSTLRDTLLPRLISGQFRLDTTIGEGS